MAADPEELVIVRSNLSSHDAHLLKGLLESNEISAFLSNENMGTLQYGVATDLLVRLKDRHIAQTVLANVVTLHNTPSSDPVAPEEDAFCRTCGSSHVHPFVGEIPSLIPGIRYDASEAGEWMHCLQCDAYYRRKRSRFSSMPVGLLWGLTLSGFTIFLLWFLNWLRWL
ncbi:hypothetical protein GCM10017044_27040 [Kordiimonas sediminis]|uniref:DUF2007 domain-containing protein n=1 Tax=Kordiimonas sediminis TaxID=1735581 RepID=A0A919AZ63_9PROT|nr:DUF2007 domain-containing protein [Kordiimonas sediminis]GHF30250.1 hypothetical protein GCM10017044_27040 [Kordiimonas sediminis]